MLLERQDEGYRCPPRGNRCWVLSGLHTSGVGLGPCRFRALLRQLNAPLAVPLQCSWSSCNSVLCVATVHGVTGSVLLFVENWFTGFCSDPFFLKKIENSQVPFWKTLSNSDFGGHEVLYEYFRGKLAKTLCSTQLKFIAKVLFGSVTQFPSNYLCHDFILFQLCPVQPEKKKRCPSFFYCIKLPFDLVTPRMSYNVESARSVLFS